MSGYSTLQVEQPLGVDAGSVAEVHLGELRGLARTGAGRQLTFIEQGSPEPGPVSLVLTLTSGEEVVVEEAYTYDPPIDPVFTRMAALDPFHPDALRAQGLDPDACDQLLGSRLTDHVEPSGAAPGPHLAVEGAQRTMQ